MWVVFYSTVTLQWVVLRLFSFPTIQLFILLPVLSLFKSVRSHFNPFRNDPSTSIDNSLSKYRWSHLNMGRSSQFRFDLIWTILNLINYFNQNQVHLKFLSWSRLVSNLSLNHNQVPLDRRCTVVVFQIVQWSGVIWKMLVRLWAIMLSVYLDLLQWIFKFYLIRTRYYLILNLYKGHYKKIQIDCLRKV